MSKSHILIGTLIAIVVGLAMTFDIYLYASYVLILGVASILVLVIVLISLFRKTTEWKIALQLLSFGYIAALTTYLTFDSREYRNKKRGDKVISALYEYRAKEGRFPRKMAELPQSIASTKGNYVPDSTLTTFKFYYKNLYGVPKVFSSKDSIWGFK